MKMHWNFLNLDSSVCCTLHMKFVLCAVMKELLEV